MGDVDDNKEDDVTNQNEVIETKVDNVTNQNEGNENQNEGNETNKDNVPKKNDYLDIIIMYYNYI